MLLLATYDRCHPCPALTCLKPVFTTAQYGGSTTAILVNLLGGIVPVVTCIDGYQMARKVERACASAAGLFFAGCVGTLILVPLRHR
jgi:TctA family transporter